MAFSFIEGALVKALRHGSWLLLDEINLAPPEVLETLSGILDSSSGGGITLVEKGSTRVLPHPGFRLIAAMNPATDSGKRNLPPSLRNKFTELWCPEPEQASDIAMLARSYLDDLGPSAPIDKIVSFYFAAKKEAVRVDECGDSICSVCGIVVKNKANSNRLRTEILVC